MKNSTGEMVVMFCGPNYGKREHARVSMSIVLAKFLGCPLIVCGDSNCGRDARAYARLAARKGVEVAVALAEGDSNTRRDAKRAAGLVAILCPKRIWLVTHWYHTPRAWIALRQEINTCLPRVKVVSFPVFADFTDGLRRLPGEVRGCVDYVLRRPHRRFGLPLGKPDEERALAQWRFRGSLQPFRLFLATQMNTR